MAASPRTEPVPRVEQGPVHPHLVELPGTGSVPRPGWRLITRHELPAILVLALLIAWATFTLHRAYEEGRACRARGGVILEIDERNYDSVPVKLCTADY